MRDETPPSLPAPDAQSAAHSARVADFIRRQIEASGGSISFAEYLQHALYAPGLGYYAAGATKFGASGDFVTAPEISPLFGRVVARQVAGVLAEVPGGTVIEYGAGSGRLAVDVLRALDELDALPARYRIVEVSADLAERQRRLLQAEAPALLPRVDWLDAPPARCRGVVIANEVLDALPFERFVRRAEGVCQQRVRMSGASFAFDEAPAAGRLAASVAAIEGELGTTLPDGYTSEVCLALAHWVGDVAGSLERGVAFLFDYGVPRREYYAPDRRDGWLRCHFRHRAHNDPLILPGIQDLTTWVDFSAVAAAALDAGLEIAGYAPQAQFLMSGGLDAEMRDFGARSTEQQLALSQQIKSLTLPGEMGERFKCMALRRGGVATPSAFRLADRTHTL